ncbi:MAG TPA: MFS transporter [Candidatus Sulfotelmatobacter sp.]|nr:MFS transporter [Candidatus Sulfotelmatobacter sp.]
MRIFYGWIIVGVAFTAWAISTGPRQTFPIFLLAFLEEFGWDRALAAGAFSVHMVAYALGGVALGVLVDRLGPRRVMALSTVALGVTLLLSSRIRNVWHLYLLFGILGGTATGGLAYVPNNAILSRWFVRSRGLAAGISQSGVPLGTAVFGPLTQLAISTIGWRRTYVAFALLVGGVALPLISVFFRDDPLEMGLHPDGVAPPEPAPAPPLLPRSRPAAIAGPGVPAGFWTVFLANILRGMTMNALLVHQVAYLVDVGYGKMAAASYFSLTALLAVVGGFAAGAISDRLGRTRTYAGIAGLTVAGIVCLLLVRNAAHSGLVYASVLATGVAMGGAGPVFAALLADRIYGPRFGFLIGLQNIAYGGGAALGPFLAGALFDAMGNYTAAFLLLAVLILCSAGIILGAARRLPSLPA